MLGKTAGGKEDLWAGRVAGPLPLKGPRNNTQHTPHTTHHTPHTTHHTPHTTHHTPHTTHHTPHTTHHTPHTKPSHGRGFQQRRTARGHSLNFCYLVTRAGGLSQDYSLRPRLPKARTNKSLASRPTPVGKLARYRSE